MQTAPPHSRRPSLWISAFCMGLGAMLASVIQAALL